MIEIIFCGLLVFVAVYVFEQSRSDRIRSQDMLIDTLLQSIEEQQKYINLLTKKK